MTLPRNRPTSWHATTVLKDRLIELNGGFTRYVEFTREALERVPGGKHLGRVYVSMLLNDSRAVPRELVVALSRIAQDDFTIPADVAMRLATESGWFTTDSGEEADRG